MTTKKQRAVIPRRTIVLLSLLAAVVFFGGIFLARGWVRGTIIHKYAEVVHLKQIDRHFAEDFRPLDDKLDALGISLTSGDASKDAGCDNVEDGGLVVSIYCHKTVRVGKDESVIDDAYKAQWQAASPAFEAYALANGWVKAGQAEQPIHELFTRDLGGVSVGVSYEKRHGKISCQLAIWHNRQQIFPGESTFNILKACEREVTFLGSY